jgi:hypothetical protein
MTTTVINPENPYVFNEYRFLNSTHLNYEESLISTIHRLINVIAPLLGIFNSSLVVYLAIWQTPRHIKSFGRMILLCSLSDIYYALCDLWCQSVSLLLFSSKNYVFRDFKSTKRPLFSH